jgi:hypothetical protein
MARSATQASGTLRFAGVRIRMRIEDGARIKGPCESTCRARRAGRIPAQACCGSVVTVALDPELACGLSQLPQRDSLIARPVNSRRVSPSGPWRRLVPRPILASSLTKAMAI